MIRFIKHALDGFAAQAIAVIATITAVAAVSASIVQAAPVTHAYEGIISTTDAPLASVNGQLLRFEYTFDSAAVDQNPSPQRGVYAASVTATIGSLTASASGFIDVQNNLFGTAGLKDQYGVIPGFLTGMQIGSFSLFAGNLLMLDPTAGVLSDDLLPALQPDPADFVSPLTAITLEFADSATNTIARLSADSFTFAGAVTAMPETGTLVIFGLGLAGLGVLRRRRTA